MKKHIYGCCALFAGLLGGCTQNIQAPVHASTPRMSVPSQYIQYVVRPGDTLGAIASQYQINYLALAKLNNIESPYPVYSGQILRVPNPAVINARIAMENHAYGGKAMPVKMDSTIPSQKINFAQESAPNSTAQAGLQNGATAGKIYVAPLPVKALPTTSSNANARAIAAQLVTQNSLYNVTHVSAPSVSTSVSVGAPAINVSPAQKRAVAQINWSWPVAGSIVESFGVSSGELGKGVQIAVSSGTKVLAAADGSVIYSGIGTSDYGEMVIIKSDNNFLTAYTHLSNLLVKQGQAVTRGSVIGVAGMINGKPMLHFELRKFGNPVDPAKYLPLESQE